MKKICNTIALATMCFVFILGLGSITVYAADKRVDVLNPVCLDAEGNILPESQLPSFCKADDNQNQAHANDNDSPLTGPDGVLTKAMDILALIVGIACVLVIIISGLRFVVSAGDTNAISSARRSLLYAVVGLLIVVMARALVRFILNKL